MAVENSIIESFIKKYRAAIANKNKDIRISIDEATDIIAAFATTNTSNQDIAKVLKNIHAELQDLKNNAATAAPTLDGGKF